MIKLGYFSHTSISPSETFIFDLIRGLSKIKDLKVDFISGSSNRFNIELPVKSYSSGFADKYSKTVYRIHKICSLKGNSAEFYRMKIRQIIATTQLEKANLSAFNVAYVEYATSGVLVMQYLEQSNIPFVVHVHGYDITEATNDKAYLAQLKNLFTKANYFIAASQYMKRRLVLLGCPEEKICVIRLGVESGQVKPTPWKEKVNSSPSIVFLGRLTEKKNPIALLHAFKIVKQSIPDVTLTLIGGGPLEDEVKKEIERLDLNQSVILKGVLDRDKSFPILSKHWVYAQHSVTSTLGDTEGFAISIAEAALHEIPVVSTIHNGISENVIDGQTGFLVPEHNYEEMGRKIIYLINNPNIAEKLGKAGRNHIIKLCNPKQRIAEIVTLLKGISK